MATHFVVNERLKLFLKRGEVKCNIAIVYKTSTKFVHIIPNYVEKFFNHTN